MHSVQCFAVALAASWALGCSSGPHARFDSAGAASGDADAAISEDASLALGGDSGSLRLGSAEGGTPGAAPAGGCDPSCGLAGGMCSGSSCSLSENPGKISAATQATLQGTGTSDAAFAWLYPYDQTVFPRGLLAPTLQFAGGASDAFYVHITSGSLDYKGYFAGGAASAGRAAMSQKGWEAVTHATGGSKLDVAVTKVSGTSLSGPIKATWTVAPGSIRGTIYYETYDSVLAGGFGSVGIMRISPGATTPAVLKQGCGNVCHTASADGSTLVAATSLASSASYDLKNDAGTLSTQGNTIFTYGGLYPDGSLLMSATNFRAYYPPAETSKLYDTKTGNNIAAPGWDGVISHGGTTAFSPDGKQLAFVHEDKDSGHTLAKMDFAVASKTFSGLVDLASDPSAYLGWPAFTPDGKQVVYQAGSNDSFETDQAATGDLFVVDVSTRTVQRLDAADGYRGGSSYLPANDPQLSFAPTVLPEVVGGYFWAVFTSHRSYGNLSPSKDNGDQNGKLWVAALDVGAAPGKDISHPAFFLDGQELTADNLRGFWVLPPCQQNGTSCASGDQCCSGFCRGSSCVARPVGCSNEYEACTSASDCCSKSDQCVNLRCASVTLPQ
jgi:hypothetical protein